MPPRRLRVFAFDPSVARQYSNRVFSELTISIPWDLDPSDPERPFLGPCGEYLDVIDYDPSSGAFYEAIDLNQTNLLASGGLSPSADDPRFHQQMVYAVAMYTISNFEEALGRVALWAPHRPNGSFPEKFVRRLRIYPHALREANAYYSQGKKALLFGYFVSGEDSEDIPPNTAVFTCLSHDIIAHEVCHALLDGMHPRYVESTNPDMLALHEAFADIIAILQHFSFPGVLREQIAKTRGDLEQQTLLGELAQEFGKAIGRGGALRDALGGICPDGKWCANKPDRTALSRKSGPHGRGSILVAAVFTAFLEIYKGRVRDLIRIASSGSGILPEGEIQPDLVNRLSSEAAKSARHMLQICIRALDYCPPVDATFGDYLRAMITADHDLYPDDAHDYRVAIIQSFSDWGILPDYLQVVSEQALLWPTLQDISRDESTELQDLEAEIGKMILNPSSMLQVVRGRDSMKDNWRLVALERDADEIMHALNEPLAKEGRSASRSRVDRHFKREQVLERNLLTLGLEANRKVEFHARNFYARLFWDLITSPQMRPLHQYIGLNLSEDAPATVYRSRTNGLPTVEVHSVRMAVRRGNRNQEEQEYVVELVQRRRGYLDVGTQNEMDAMSEVPKKERGDFTFRRGCTLLIDAKTFEIRRVIRTRGTVCDNKELDRMRRYLKGRAATPRNAFDGGEPSESRCSETFANLHRNFRGD